MKKIVIVFLTVILLCITITGCKNEKTESKTAETSTTKTTKTTAEVPSNIVTNKNFLTGAALTNPNAFGKRPVAVMINNIKDALPQYGIEAADIIFEVPVEGGITRLMAVYNDFTNVPKICSVRSCRYYYPLIALGMDAIYIHWGADASIATDTLKSTKIDRFDGATLGVEYFGRDKERLKTYSSEHTGFLDGTKLAEAIQKYGYRKDLSADYGQTLFKFSETQIIPSGINCATAILNFSNAYFSTFTYDNATTSYKKQHSGKPQIDSSTGNQLAFKNVIILQTDIKNRTNSKLMDVNLTKGKGKYISNGAEQDVLWSKAGNKSPIVLTKLDGTPLLINKGKSYIAFIGNEKTITIS